MLCSRYCWCEEAFYVSYGKCLWFHNKQPQASRSHIQNSLHGSSISIGPQRVVVQTKSADSMPDDSAAAPSDEAPRVPPLPRCVSFETTSHTSDSTEPPGAAPDGRLMDLNQDIDSAVGVLPPPPTRQSTQSSATPPPTRQSSQSSADDGAMNPTWEQRERGEPPRRSGWAMVRRQWSMPSSDVERLTQSAPSRFQELHRQLSRARSVSDALINPVELMDRLADVVQSRLTRPESRGAARLRGVGRIVIASLRMARLGSKPDVPPLAAEEDEQHEEEHDEYLAFLGREVELVGLGGEHARLNGSRCRAVRWDAEKERMGVALLGAGATAAGSGAAHGLLFIRLVNLRLDDETSRSTNAWGQEAARLRWRSDLLILADAAAEALIKLAGRYPAEICMLRACAASEHARMWCGRDAYLASAQVASVRRDVLGERAYELESARIKCAKLKGSGTLSSGLSYRDACIRVNNEYNSLVRQANAAEENRQLAIQAAEAAKAAAEGIERADLPQRLGSHLSAHAAWHDARLRPWRHYEGFAAAAASAVVGAVARNACTTLLRSLGGVGAAEASPAWIVLLAPILASVPQLKLDARWVRRTVPRLLLTDSGAPQTTTNGGGTAGGVDGHQGAPASSTLWLHLPRAYAEPTTRPWDLIRRLLPSSHPLHEGRSLVASLRATSLVALVTVGLPYYLMPLPDLSVSLVVDRIWLGCSSWLPAALLGTLTSRALRRVYGRLRADVLAPLVLGAPLDVHEKRLCTAEERAQANGLALVDVGMMQRVATRAAAAAVEANADAAGFGAPPMLARQSSMKAKLAAKDVLAPKRTRLFQRIRRSLEQQLRGRPPTPPVLFVRRNAPHETLSRVAALPASKLRIIRVKTVIGLSPHRRSTWEAAVDYGGPFRETLRLLSDFLSDADARAGLLQPTADGSLLPAPAAEAERASLSSEEAAEVDVVIPIRPDEDGRDGEARGGSLRDDEHGCVRGVFLAFCPPCPREGRVAVVPAALSAYLRQGDAVLSVNGRPLTAEAADPGDGAAPVLPWPIAKHEGKAGSLRLRLRRGLKPHHPNWRSELRGLGRVLALAVLNETPLDVCLSRCLYKVLLHEPITPEDVRRVDADFARHRVYALLQDGGVAAMEAVLMDELRFVAVAHEGDGDADGEELLPGGAAMRVTEDNKHFFCALLVEHYLVGFVRAELAVLAEGFFDVIPAAVLRGDVTVPALTALDLELICAGLPGIDMDDWEAHTHWIRQGPDGMAELPIHEYAQLRHMFFCALRAMDLDERARVLSFATGSGRLPAAGFRALKPPFSVEVLPNSTTDHLPQAHTCFNNIGIPLYESEEQLAERLRRAVASDVGFGFA